MEVKKLCGDPKTVDERVKALTDEFPTVFTGKLGCFKDFKVNIPILADVKPRFFKARPVPYSMRERVEQ